MRITSKTLYKLADQLNVMVGAPEHAWIGEKAQVGHYYISGAYGGYALHKIINEAGGAEDVFGIGHMPARQLYNMMRAYKQGIWEGKQLERLEWKRREEETSTPVYPNS